MSERPRTCRESGKNDRMRTNSLNDTRQIKGDTKTFDRPRTSKGYRTNQVPVSSSLNGTYGSKGDSRTCDRPGTSKGLIRSDRPRTTCKDTRKPIVGVGSSPDVKSLPNNRQTNDGSNNSSVRGDKNKVKNNASNTSSLEKSSSIQSSRRATASH